MSMPLEVFRAGRHFAMSGEAIEFGPAHLAAIAAAYDPENHEAPLVVGHPTAAAPSYGWVRKLKVEGDRLVAELDQVDQAFADMVREGRFKKVLASFYKPDSPANPTPGRWHLRHVGFLGAQPPAVKGLRPAQFAAADGALEFSSAPVTPAPARDPVDVRALVRDAENYREAMAERGIVVTTKAAVEHIRAGGTIPAPAAGGAAQSVSYAEDVARQAQMIQAASPTPMGLPEAIRRAQSALAARLADGRTAGLEAADPEEIGRRARAHQARLAAMGVFIGAGEAVRQVLDGASPA